MAVSGIENTIIIVIVPVMGHHPGMIILDYISIIANYQEK